MVSDRLLIDYLLAHWKLAIAALIVCEGFGLRLVAHLWVTRRKLSLIRKLALSFVLLIPLIGWLFSWGGDFGPGSQHF